jgi:transcriptional regulator with XRE-family HTH domain
VKLGEIIRRWRLSKDLSVAEVAKEIGVSSSTLVHIEMGSMPPASKTLIAVLSWLTSEDKTNGTGKAEREPASVGQESGGEAPAPDGE